jgi:hypothetical protein
MTANTDDLSRAWASYVQGASSIVGSNRAVDPNLVRQEIRVAFLRESLRDLDAEARARLVEARVWTPDTAAEVARLVGAASPNTDGAAEGAALLTMRLDRILWDVVLFAVEGFVWLLPSPQLATALRSLAIARTTFPSPYLRPATAAHESAAADAERCRRALAHAPSVVAEDAFLTAVKWLRGSLRWPLIKDAAPLLTGSRRSDALRQALDSAFEVLDEVHIGSAVAMVVLRDPALLLETALKRANEAWGDSDALAWMLIELAEDLPAEHLAPILDEAARIEDEWSRAEILLALRRRLPAGLRGRWEQMVQAIEDDSAMACLECDVAEPKPPPAEPSSLTDAINGWGCVARTLEGEPLGAAIAAAVVQFVVDTMQLYAQTTRRPGIP